MILACAAPLALATPALAQPPAWRPEAYRAPPGADEAALAVEAALRAHVQSGGVTEEVASFYSARGFEPLWAPGRPRPEAEQLAEALGVDPARPRWDVGWRSEADPRALAEFELRLSEAFVANLRDRPAGTRGAGLEYVDPLLQPKGAGRLALEAAAEAEDLDAHLAEVINARNPVQAQLESALERYRLDWGGLPDVAVPPGPELAPGSRGPRVAALRGRLAMPGDGYDEGLAAAVQAFQAAHGLPATGRADAATVAALNRGAAHYEGVILANIERARALPASFGERFVLVDAAAGRLWLYDGGQERASMKVVAGKPSQPTPTMAATVSHMIFNPYWNVPEDLVRTSIAPKVLAQGLGYVRSEGLEVLADYSPGAAKLDPATVDWRAVARGEVSVRVRQRPGPKNMMGKVKLMLRNPLGIYLHDTPHKGDFAKSERFASSGCVRLEDAVALARALAGDAAVDAALAGGEEVRVDLEQPMPVYITYFTAAPSETGLVFRPDVYGRDRLRMADAGSASSGPSAAP
jgi:L,D-transpeptidase YcbB